MDYVLGSTIVWLVRFAIFGAFAAVVAPLGGIGWLVALLIRVFV